MCSSVVLERVLPPSLLMSLSFWQPYSFVMHLTLLMLSLDRVALHCEHACIGKCFDHQVQLTFTWYAKRLTVRMLFLENVSTMKLMLHVMADKFINMTSDIHR